MFLQNSNSTALDKTIESASEVTTTAYSSIDNLINQIVAQLPLVAAGMIVLVFFWLLGKIFKAIFLSTSSRTKLDERLRILVSRLISITIFVLGFFTALTIIIPNFSFGQLVAGLGFTSFIIGFATKDILNNLLSGVLILWKQPFHIGDYIFIKDKQGSVKYIGVRATRLGMDDGEQILIPNGEMYSNALVIRSAGSHRRMRLKISIGYGSKVQEAKAIILRVLEKLETIVNEPHPTVYVTDLVAEGINLSVYFWVDTDKNSPLKVFDEVAMGINRELREADIGLYPPNPVIIKNEDNVDISSNYKKEDL